VKGTLFDIGDGIIILILKLVKTHGLYKKSKGCSKLIRSMEIDGLKLQGN